MYEDFEIVISLHCQSLFTHIEEKVEDHFWDANGLNGELLEQFIIDISSDDNDDNISDSGENVDSMEENNLAKDVCSYNSLFIFISYIYRSKFALENQSAIRWCYLITSR